MSLDDKLKEILRTEGSGLANWEDHVVAQIKQAFADEGYIKGLHRSDKTGKWQPMSDMMTGQEFYERFKKNLDRNIVYHNNIDLQDAFVRGLSYGMTAAKKAAGL